MFIFCISCSSIKSIEDAIDKPLHSVARLLVDSNFSKCAMPDPTKKTNYDNDYKNMVTHYAEYVENYAKMKRILAVAAKRTEEANALDKTITAIRLLGNVNLLKCAIYS